MKKRAAKKTKRCQCLVVYKGKDRFDGRTKATVCGTQGRAGLRKVYDSLERAPTKGLKRMYIKCNKFGRAVINRAR